MKSDRIVYLIKRLDGTPLYVGKGAPSRWKKHFRACTNPHLWAVIQQARKIGQELPVEVLFHGLTDERACEIERDLIASIRREDHGGTLVNLTDGGDGTAGIVVTDEFRARCRARSLERWSSSEYRAAHAERMRGNSHKKGKPNSDLQKTVTSERMKGNKQSLGRKPSDEQRAKQSVSLKGRPKSAEHRMAISAGLTGRVINEETRSRISAANTGKRLSEETKAKISLGGKGRVVSAEVRALVSANMKGKRYFLGRKHTPESIAKMRLAKAERDRSAPPYRHTEETRAKMRAAHAARLAKALP